MPTLSFSYRAFSSSESVAASFIPKIRMIFERYCKLSNSPPEELPEGTCQAFSAVLVSGFIPAAANTGIAKVKNVQRRQASRRHGQQITSVMPDVVL